MTWGVYEIPGEVHIVPTVAEHPIPPHIIDDMCVCCPVVDSATEGVRVIVHRDEN